MVVPGCSSRTAECSTPRAGGSTRIAVGVPASERAVQGGCVTTSDGASEVAARYPTLQNRMRAQRSAPARPKRARDPWGIRAQWIGSALDAAQTSAGTAVSPARSLSIPVWMSRGASGFAWIRRRSEEEIPRRDRSASAAGQDGC